MSPSQPQGPLCQCCAMPMRTEEEFGRNADGSKNLEYCCYCFKNGAFSTPNITLNQMIEKVAALMKKMGMTDEQILKTKQLIPTLKRWRK